MLDGMYSSKHWRSEHGYEDSCDYWTLLLSRAMLKGCFSILCTYDQEHFSAIWLSCFSLLCSTLLGFCLVCWCFFRLLLLSELSCEFIGPQKNWTAIPLGTAALGFRGHPREKTISLIPQRSSCFCFSEIASPA